MRWEPQAAETGSDWLDRIVARRVDSPELVAPPLKRLDHPGLLPDMDRAVERLVAAVDGQETIALVTDHDGDGTGACAVLHQGLIEHLGADPERIVPFVTHRLEEGYGLSDAVVDRILDEPTRPGLVITADQGSADNDRIERLAAAGIDTIVTDHHHIPGDGAVAAHAFVSPARPDSRYPDRTIAGGMVAWLLIAAACRRGRGRGDVRDLLDYVAISTVADCVTLGGSANNRAVVRYGLSLINLGSRPWSAAWRERAGEHNPVGAQTLAYQIAPMVAARGRLDEPLSAVRFLTAPDLDVARRLLCVLTEANDERKRIERELVERLLPDALAQRAAGRRAIVCFDPQAHPGVRGIAAARIGERCERPCIVFSPDRGMLGGSARAVIDGVDIRVGIEQVATRRPELVARFGGHAAAAGVTLPGPEAVEPFAEALDEALDDAALAGLVRAHDGEQDPTQLVIDEVAALERLEPFGRGFEPPLHLAELRVRDARPVGDGTHLKLTFEGAGGPIGGVWFRAMAAGDEPPVDVGERKIFAYTPVVSRYNGRTRIDVQVQGLVEQ